MSSVPAQRVFEPGHGVGRFPLMEPEHPEVIRAVRRLWAALLARRPELSFGLRVLAQARQNLTELIAEHRGRLGALQGAIIKGDSAREIPGILQGLSVIPVHHRLAQI